MKLAARGFTFEIDDEGQIGSISTKAARFQPAYSLFEIDKEIAESRKGSAEGSFSLSAKAVSGLLTVSADTEIRARFTADAGGTAATVGLTIPFPEDAVFHVPEDYTLAHKISKDMPVGHEYSTPLGFNFFLVRVKGLWIRIMCRQPDPVQRRRAASLSLARHPGMFTATFTWKAADEARIAVFPSMKAATDDYRQWLEKDVGVRTLKARPETPAWVNKMRLVLIIDMMRSDGEISHDYADVAGMVKDLKKNGCPANTLLYLPGWNGAYDAMYPDYAPVPELGGAEGFRAMMEAVHENGFRVMIHTNPWGVDPSNPNLDSYLKYLVKDKDGNYAGFQTYSNTKWGQAAPTFRLLKFRTGRIAVGIKATDMVEFASVAVPDKAESILSIGGLRAGDYRLAVTIGRRTLTTPPGAFSASGQYTFPFAHLLRPGKNKVRIEVRGATGVDLGGCWYSIDKCRVPPDPYCTWSYPILFADTLNPEWAAIFAAKVAETVKEYGIDAIHFDATEYDWNKKVYEEISRLLPNVPKAGEGFSTLNAMGYWTLAQMGRGQSLIGYLDVLRGTRQQGSIPDTGKIEELYAWLDQESPVVSWLGEYVKLYPHLCAADGFVPTGKVCNGSPKMQSPRTKASLWKILHDVPRLRYIAGLRLNYREYGLDADARKAIRLIAAGDL